MITSLLIANRGEIACRIIRTARDDGDPHGRGLFGCRRQGAARAAWPTRRCISGRRRRAKAIWSATRSSPRPRRAGAEAIHPGYGFLSENADFAQAVIDAGLVWVGPKPDSIRAMGLKDAAKALMAAAGRAGDAGLYGRRPGPARSSPSRRRAIGYPVLIKAVAGGGGKGMRKVDARGGFRRRARKLPARGGVVVRQRRRADRKMDRKPAPYRGAGVRRQPTATSSICSSATARSSGATRR